MPLVMCVFYFQSKLTLKVSTHITNATVIINNMHCMYIAEMYTIPFESYISSVYISAVYIQCKLLYH